MCTCISFYFFVKCGCTEDPVLAFFLKCNLSFFCTILIKNIIDHLSFGVLIRDQGTQRYIYQPECCLYTVFQVGYNCIKYSG